MSLENKLNKIETKNNEPKVVSQEEFNAEIEEKISIANDPSTTPEILAELGEYPSEEVRASVVHNINTSPETLAELGKDPSEMINASVANNPNTPPDTLVELSKDPGEEDGIPLVRLYIANNKSTPRETLAELAKDTNAGVRISVASNESTPEETLAELIEDPDSGVSLTAKENLKNRKNISEETPVQSSKSSNNSTKKVAAIGLTIALALGLGGQKADAGLPEGLPEGVEPYVSLSDEKSPRNSEGISVDILVEWSEYSTDSIRRFVADHEDTPNYILVKLIGDSNPHISLAALKNLRNRKNLSEETFVQLSEASGNYYSHYARRFVADHEDTPDYILVKLIGDDNRYISKAAIENLRNRPSLSEETLVQMSKSFGNYYSHYARRIAADHKNTPDYILVKLIGDDNSHISKAAIENLRNRPSLSEETLVQMSKSFGNYYSHYARRIAADHKNTPLETLAELAKDDNRHISGAAIKNLEKRQKKAA